MIRRRDVLLGWMAVMAGLPAAATAAETGARRRGSSKTSSSKPGLAERSNKRVGRATESNTATKMKKKATKGDDAMNRLVGRTPKR